MDLGGIAAVGAGIALIYLVRRRRGRPTPASGDTQRTRGESGRVPKRSWLVKAYNSAGVAKVESDDLKGATAELAGRAIGGAGRRGKRRWSIVKAAAGRSRTRREKHWQTDPPLPPITRRRKPAVAPGPPAASAKPPDTPTPDPPASPAPAGRHLKAVPDPTTPGAAVTTTQDTPAPTTMAAPEVPPDWTLMIDRVRNLRPEDDTALMAFMHGEASGVVAYAEALQQARDNCVTDVGLDPSAVTGFTTYSEHVSEAAQRMSEAYQTFVAVYGEVQALAANGVVMPHNGRWFNGAAG